MLFLYAGFFFSLTANMQYFALADAAIHKLISNSARRRDGWPVKFKILVQGTDYLKVREFSSAHF